MNKTESKKIQAKLSKVVALAYKINTTTSYQLFFSFSGHTGDFQIHGYKNGWVLDRPRSFDYNFYLGFGQGKDLTNFDEVDKKLDEVLGKLSVILLNF